MRGKRESKEYRKAIHSRVWKTAIYLKLYSWKSNKKKGYMTVWFYIWSKAVLIYSNRSIGYHTRINEYLIQSDVGRNALKTAPTKYIIKTRFN